MKMVIFGLSVTSAWGNGHATLWRGLLRALVRRGHRIVFVEKNVPWYAEHRDLTELEGVEIILYPDWTSVQERAGQEVRDCDAAIVTSYCPNSEEASALVRSANCLKVFYDLDAPVTLTRLRNGEKVDYVPEGGYRGFDVVMSYTGGRAIEELQDVLGAVRAVPIYGSVDPDAHYPAPSIEQWQGDLSYLGTWAADRQQGVNRLLVEPARRRPDLRFVIGGAMYNDAFPWTRNIFFHPHISPAYHSSFYCSSRVTLNVTRQAMADYGYCPSGRLFEAAACGVPIISDVWEGLDQFFEPGAEILTAAGPNDVLCALDRDAEELASIAHRARERTLDEHTADDRAVDFENVLVASAVFHAGAGAGA